MKWKDCVTTLPISPVNQPSIGLMITPLIADVFAKKMKICNVASFNLNGIKSKKTNIHSAYLECLTTMCSMGIASHYIWQDNSQNIAQINNIFKVLIEQNKIIKKRKVIMRCKCGAIESLKEAENLSASRQLYYIKNKQKYCKLCHGKIHETKSEVLLFLFSKNNFICNIYPKFYSKEMNAMASKFDGREFLISRSRSSSLKINCYGKKYGIDVDFIWQMFLVLLYYQGYNTKILIGGNKNLMASLFTISIFNLLVNEKPHLIIPPYYLAPQKKQLKGKKYSCHSILEKYDPKSVRLFLISFLNWNKKETVLDFNFLELISKMIYRVKSTSNIMTIDDIPFNLEHQKIKQILSRIRKTRKHFISKDLFGVI